MEPAADSDEKALAPGEKMKGDEPSPPVLPEDLEPGSDADQFLWGV